MNPMNFHRRSRLLVRAAALSLGLFCLTPAADAAFVPATSPAISYYGRWDVQRTKKVCRAGQGAVYLRARFTGTCLAADLTSPNEWWRVSIDDSPWRRLRPQGPGTVLAENLAPGTHSVTLVRSTEARSGISTLRGFTVDDDAAILPTEEHHPRAIEFVGDSIAAGAKNDGVEEGRHYQGQDYDDVEDGNQSFAPQLARMLDAEFSVIAKSGEGVLHNYAEPWPGHQVHAADHYPWTFYYAKRNRHNLNWQTKEFPVDAIIVALGTNDFTDPHRQPTEEEFTNAYVHLLKTIRHLNPETPIICTEPVPYAIGRTSGPWIASAVGRMRQKGDTGVHYIALNDDGPLLTDDDYAFDGTHPTQAGAKKIAAFLKGKVAKILSWE